MWDTAGQEEYKKLRTLSYPETDVFLLCFSVVYPDTLENVELQWIPEVKQYCPEAKIVLVGTKIDLREQEKNRGGQVVTFQQGEEVARRVGALYDECSARTQDGLKRTFDKAIRCVIFPNSLVETAGTKKKIRKTKTCNIL